MASRQPVIENCYGLNHSSLRSVLAAPRSLLQPSYRAGVTASPAYFPGFSHGIPWNMTTDREPTNAGQLGEPLMATTMPVAIQRSAY